MEAETDAKGWYYRKRQAYEEVATWDQSSQRNMALPADHGLVHSETAVNVGKLLYNLFPYMYVEEVEDKLYKCNVLNCTHVGEVIDI